MRIGVGILLLAIGAAVPPAAQAAAPALVSKAAEPKLACPSTRMAALDQWSVTPATARKLRVGRPARTMTARL